MERLIFKSRTTSEIMGLNHKNRDYSCIKGKVSIIEVKSIESFNLALLNSSVSPTVACVRDESIDILLERKISPSISLKMMLHEIKTLGISFPYLTMTGDIYEIAEILNLEGMITIREDELSLDKVVRSYISKKMAELKQNSVKKMAGIPDYLLK